LSHAAPTGAIAANRRAYGVVAAAAVASHLTALNAGFVWLDHAHVESGLALAEPSGWLDLFARGFAETGFYRPLMALSLSIDALFGSPFVFHATSLAWHAAAAVATLATALALGSKPRAARLAALLFAVHPLSGLVANAIAFRSEAMVTTLLLVFVWAHARRRTVIAAVALFAACLTKEIALGLGPAFVVAVELSRRRIEPPPAGRARDRGLWLAEAAALAAALALRVAYAPPFRARHLPLALGDALGTRLAALAKSAMLLVAPVDLTVCDAFPVTHLWHPRALAGALALASLLVLAHRRRGSALLLVLALLPSIHLVPVMRWWSPHYVYLPAAFALMLAGDFVDRLGDRAVWVARTVAVVFGIVSLIDARKYESDTSLWSPEVSARPTCAEGQFYLGEVHREARRWGEAEARYEAALAIRPNVLAYVDRGAALVNLGTVQLEQRRFAEARRSFQRAEDGATNERARREIVHNLAALALQSGNFAEADELLVPETRRPDAMPASLVVRAMALRELGRAEEAAALLARVSE
jgi:tetratricopeptide (TPR) repeat protein